MTSPAKPTPIRYVRDRVTDARWVSAERVSTLVAYAEIDRLRAAGRSTVSTEHGRVYVDWSHEATPNPGKRASGPSGRRVAPRAPEERLALGAEGRAALDALVARSGESRSAVVRRLVLAAAKG